MKAYVSTAKLDCLALLCLALAASVAACGTRSSSTASSSIADTVQTSEVTSSGPTTTNNLKYAIGTSTYIMSGTVSSVADEQPVLVDDENLPYPKRLVSCIGFKPDGVVSAIRTTFTDTAAKEVWGFEQDPQKVGPLVTVRVPGDTQPYDSAADPTDVFVAHGFTVLHNQPTAKLTPGTRYVLGIIGDFHKNQACGQSAPTPTYIVAYAFPFDGTTVEVTGVVDPQKITLDELKALIDKYVLVTTP